MILRKAFELQDPDSGTTPPDGMSLAEIQAVAWEVGLDPAVVERAAALVQQHSTGTLGRLFGGPTIYELLHSADGEVPREDYGKLVEAIRRAAGHQGQGTELLGSLEWKTVGEPSSDPRHDQSA